MIATSPPQPPRAPLFNKPPAAAAAPVAPPAAAAPAQPAALPAPQFTGPLHHEIDFTESPAHALALSLRHAGSTVVQISEIATRLETTAASVIDMAERIEGLTDTQVSRAEKAIDEAAVKVCSARLDAHMNAVWRAADDTVASVSKDIATHVHNAAARAIDRVIEAKNAEIAAIVARAATPAPQTEPEAASGWRLTPWVAIGLMIVGIVIGKFL